MSKNLTIGGASYSDVPSIDVPVTGGGTARYYDATQVSVSASVTNASSNNSQTTAFTGQSYGAVITANTNYTISSVVVTMGGTDISSSCVTSVSDTISIIAIPNVTGALVITATATAAAFDPNIVVGGFAHSVGNDFTTDETTSTSYSKSSVIDVTGCTWINIKNTATVSGDYYIYFAGDDNIIDSSVTCSFSVKDHTVTIPDGTTRIRIRGYAALLENKALFTWTKG